MLTPQSASFRGSCTLATEMISGDDRAVMRRKSSRETLHNLVLRSVCLIRLCYNIHKVGFKPDFYHESLGKMMTNLTRHQLENCAEVHETVFFRNEKLGGGNSTMFYFHPYTPVN